MQSSIQTSIPVVIKYFRSTKKLFEQLGSTFSHKSARSTFATTLASNSDQSKSIMSQQQEPAVNSSTSDKVYIQRSPDKDTITISFQYDFNGGVKKFNLNRKGTETSALALERIKLNLLKLAKSKPNKKLAQIETLASGATCGLSFNGVMIDPHKTSNINAWIEGVIFELNGKSYEVRTNDPQVRTLKLPPCLMQGFTTIPAVNVENCNINDCKFVWYRRISVDDKRKLIDEGVDSSLIEVDSDNRYCYRLAEGITYSPSRDDIAHYLRIVCHPSDGVKFGPITDCFSEKPVEVGPSDCPFEKRHHHTREILSEPEEFRCITYNILADLYADSDYSRDVLFDYCPSFALDINYRRQLLTKEIQGYNADLICLQEVDKKEFVRTYEPFFSISGNYSGIFDTKGGQAGEGVATFFRCDKFEVIDTHSTKLSDLIRWTSRRPDASENIYNSNSGGPERKETACETRIDSRPHLILDGETSQAEKCLSNFDAIRSAISSNQYLSKRFMDRHTVLQTTLFKFKNSANKFILVANTHLYFAPDADHVRLLQGSVCVKYVEYLKNYFKSKLTSLPNGSEATIGIVLCGDMNSTPDCGLYQLVTEGRISENLPDWSSNEEEKVVGLSLETPLRFSPAYEHLDYTNYTPGFKGCLDYIYYERDNIICKSTVPVPDHEDVIATGGIPSVLFPSDHLALIADLKYINESP